MMVLALAAGAAGCMPRNEATAAPAAPDMHNSRNALDWAGVYEGVLPCADCPGIQTRLSLQQDGRFELSMRYLERQVEPFVSRGSFSWNADGNTITLDGAGAGAMYRVGEGHLLQLDRDGSLPAPSAHNRTLTKVAAGAPAPTLAKALQDHRWTLRSASNAQGKAIEALAGSTAPATTAPIVFDFDARRVAIRGACNNMNGGFELSGDGQLKFDRMAETMRACEPASMQADAALSAMLAQPLKAEFTPGLTAALRLTSATNGTLEFSGRPTPQSLYGAPTRVFLEVAARTVSCQPGAGAPRQCIQVRELRFDEKGLRVGPPGDWRAFYSPIEGYTHEAGVRNVLRIDRYTRTNVPADASAHVYVLDMVVESEKMPG
jgi:uncharacterized lipoprotein NlpE involved in copper resistance